MVPLDRLTSEVFAVAKRDLVAGDTLDAIGGSAYYSLIDTYETASAERLLPIGLATGARVIRPVAMDTPITAADIEIKPSTVYSLRQLQDQWSQGRSPIQSCSQPSTSWRPSKGRGSKEERTWHEPHWE